MSDLIAESIEKFEKRLDDIVTKKIPLRDPSICVVHISTKHFKNGNIAFSTMLKRLRTKHSEWEYVLFNAEREVFEILKTYRYITKQKFIFDCTRSDFAYNLRDTIKKQLIKRIEEKVLQLNKERSPISPPTFMIIQNANANYDYIQVKDIIAEIRNQKGLYILIIYLQRASMQNFDNKAYIDANYNVDSYLLF